MAFEDLPKYTVIQGDDWAGIYLNDKLHMETHKISICDLSFYAQGKPFLLEYRDTSGEMEDYLENHGSFPVSLEEALDMFI